MAKTRVITPYTEILAQQPNELQQYFHQDMELIVDGIIGATTGTVKGLEISINDAPNRIVGISSGAICDGLGKFYEIVEASGSTVTLPNVDGTYYIYGTMSSTTDVPVSGYSLIDVSTRIETYGVLNTRSYDSITLSGTTSTIPYQAQLFGSAVVVGGVITSITDLRSYVQLGNVLSNSLQGFYSNLTNTSRIINKITGTILIDDTLPKFIKIFTDSSVTGQAIWVDNGYNTSSEAIHLNIYNNIGVKIQHNIGNSSGIVIEGNTSGDVGLTLNNVEKGIEIQTNSTSSNNYGIELKKIGSGRFYKGFSLNDYLTGIELNNTGATTGIIINGNQTTNEVGISLNSLKKSIDINARHTGIDIHLSGSIVSDSYLLNKGVATTIKGQGLGNYTLIDITDTSSAYGMFVSSNSPSNGNVFGIGLKGGTGYFQKGVEIENSITGVSIITTANGTGMKVVGNTTSTGIEILDSNYGIKIKNLTASSLPAGIQIGAGNTDVFEDGIAISNCTIGVETFMEDSGVGLKVHGVAGTTGLYVNGFTSDLTQTGIYISNTKTGIYIDNTSLASYNSYINKIIGTGNTTADCEAWFITDCYAAMKVSNCKVGLQTETDVDYPLFLKPILTASITAGTFGGEIVVEDTGATTKVKVWDAHTSAWLALN